MSKNMPSNVIPFIRKAAPSLGYNPSQKMQKIQQKAVSALIEHVAYKLKTEPEEITEITCRVFGVRTLSDLQSSNYERAIEFLVDLPCATGPEN